MIGVIGASGFIGTYLVDELLKEGYNVVATGRNKKAESYYKSKNIPFVTLDIRNKEDFQKLPGEKLEAVVLLSALLPANVKNYNIYDYIDINVTGTLNVLEYCRRYNIKKVISTTSYADVQNLWEKGNTIKEVDGRNYKYTGDHAAYVFSKNMASDLIQHYNYEYDMKGMIFRLPPVYGVGPHSQIYVDGKKYKSGFQIFVDKAISGENIEIFGDASVSRDVVYIKDVIKAFILGMKSEKARGLYNISSGVAISLDEQVKSIINIFSDPNNKSKIVYRTDKFNGSSSYVFDISKANIDFGYKPKYVPFEKMLIDYKKELENKRFQFLIERGNKK
ncbi:NAD-dependent epimerase/dehydratase family protein [Clostridium botulinum]